MTDAKRLAPSDCETAAASIDCPTCGALGGEPCRVMESKIGRVGQPHRGRKVQHTTRWFKAERFWPELWK